MMRLSRSLKPFWALSIIFLSGCSDRPIEIIDARTPLKIESEDLRQSTWVITLQTKGDKYNSLKDSGSFYIFKSSCKGGGSEEEIGFIIENKNIGGNEWTFAIDDNHLQGDGYRGIAKGDCVFIKTKSYFFSTRYRSNVIALH